MVTSRSGLRPKYDLAIPPLDTDDGSRGRILRAIARGSYVLDVGCDTGRFGAALSSERACTVDGIELDAAAAKAAEGRLRRVFWRDIRQAGAFEDLSGYDAVLFLDVLEHLPDPWAVLLNARNALQPQGTIYVVTPNIAHVSVVRRLLKGEFEYQTHGTMDRTHLRWFTRKSLAQCLEDCGFANVRVEPVPSVPWLDESRLGVPIGRLLARLFPNLLSGSLIGIGSLPEFAHLMADNSGQRISDSAPSIQGP